MEKEIIIQLDGDYALTNRGRVFRRYVKDGSFERAWTLETAPLELEQAEKD